MPRKKKDGRHINYYIDREIYERLEAYADEKGQPMTTAIERILKEHLDQYDDERDIRGGGLMFCPKCNSLFRGNRCTGCGNKDVRQPSENDFCYLAEKESIWAGLLSDVLTQNDIRFVTDNVLGAGLASKLGSAAERVRFYVLYSQYQAASDLVNELFAAPNSEKE